MPIRNRGGRKVFIDRSIKKKKETILLEVPKDYEPDEYLNGFEVIKKVKRFGKYYALVKNKWVDILCCRIDSKLIS